MNIWKIFQYVSFQCLWLIAVIGGNSWAWSALIIIAVHLAFSPSKLIDTKLMALALIGMAVDAALTFAGVFSFSQWPLWLAVLWLGFVLNFGHSLGFLSKIPLVYVSLLGGLSGAWSYIAGWKLGAVELPLGFTSTVIILAMVWAILLPVLISLDKYFRPAQPQSNQTLETFSGEKRKWSFNR